LWALVVLLALAVDVPLAQGLIDGCRQLLAFAGDDGAAQLLAQERLERLSQLALDRAVIPDQQPLEEGEIELPPHGVRGFAVSRFTVSGSRQGAL